MSDPRLHAWCTTCGHTASGTFIPEWIESHLEATPDHHITVTRSGLTPADVGTPYPSG